MGRKRRTQRRSCAGLRRSSVETEHRLVRPSAEPSCSASGCQSPSHSAGSFSASWFCLTMILLGKSGLSHLEARHIAPTLYSGQNECQQENPEIKNKNLAFPEHAV